MDRFIVLDNEPLDRSYKPLKSNMDRFIVPTFDESCIDIIALKSNMDRFIVMAEPVKLPSGNL